ncbi:hypothetical protein G7Y89_g575 [Cudoniella acicularis]|uniref:ATP-dependent (S)-NAD(P)H-hydrate dehydratase n=1 Tax=Cudoniella acicularis TaxID=354080 RepID=A0A8H4RXX7_9HELO|nr:hypothetical protein G7Y89_g575 [Cudoniella acicularis]
MGRVAVIGGSEDYTGAPFFSAMASAKLGADMSHVICEPQAAQVIKTYSPNLMVHPLMRQSSYTQASENSSSVAKTVIDMLPRLHVLVIGPGLGRDPLMLEICAKVIEAARKENMPFVLDADGLNLAQTRPELIHGYKECILTPNIVEFGRLCKSKGIDGDGLEDGKGAETLSKAFGGVTILQKGKEDYISNGDNTFVCDIKGGLKRSGGQGDTLTGSLATFLAWRKAYLEKLWEHDDDLNEVELLALAAFGGIQYLRNYFESYRQSIDIKADQSQLWDLVFKSYHQPAGSEFSKKLPFGLGSFTRYNKPAWNYYDKFNMHTEYGKIFLHVTPGGNALFVADAAASDIILSRRKEFLKPIEMLESVDLFGKSLASVEGVDWQRHRKITAPPFNERNSGLVWVESLRQAKQMLHYWTTQLDVKKSIPNDTSRLALHVLTGAGFGMTYQFRGSLDTPGKGFRFTYRDALDITMSDAVLLIVTPRIVYSFPFLPKKLAQHKAAVSEFKRYLFNMVSAAKERAVQGEPAHPDLLNTLVQKAQEAENDPDSKSGVLPGNIGLSDEEIYGNLFMFSFAGHETTANALAYSTYLFAAFPEWQEWVAAEVGEVFKGHSSIETLDYELMFPRLKRCFALMLETLRLYSPVLTVPKCTGAAPATLRMDGREITVPPHTHIFLNIVALQTSPEYWGVDALAWKPGRWIKSLSQPSTLPTSPISDKEEIVTPVKGSFIPWADGPRVCPGKKFSQVEFVAVIAVLLWKHRVEVIPREGEKAEEARKRVAAVVEDSGTKFTLQMRRPETVDLRFVERLLGFGALEYLMVL